MSTPTRDISVSHVQELDHYDITSVTHDYAYNFIIAVEIMQKF